MPATPDLHTHLVIANKVRSTNGRWYALNTNLIYKAKVAASELYSATLEASLAETFGIRFVERSTGAGTSPSVTSTASTSASQPAGAPDAARSNTAATNSPPPSSPITVARPSRPR